MKKGIILIITLFCMQFSFAQCELDPKHPWDLMKLNQIISQGGICADAWDCSFPRRLANLTISAGNLTGNVDLSGCTGLQVLNCANNHITSLNLSGCLLLQSINCSNNWISNINLNGCNSLQSIVCNYNLITNLDVSNKLLLQGVNCSNNLLTNINISGCNQLLSVFCQNNKLTEFNAYSSATLTNVDCSMNKISNLKFNGCTSLKKLNCKQNKLKNSALTSLYGLKLGQGISNYNLDLRQNIGFTSNAIHKLDSNLQYLNYNQILYDSVSDQFSTELNWYNETNDSITHPYGVATDGSATIKLTVIREQGYSVIDSIRIQLQNYNNTNTDPLGTIAYCSLYNTSSDTIFTFSQTGLNQWEFLYIAPDVFTNTSNSNINKRFVNAVVTIYYTKTGIDSSYTCNQKIELIRPPVLFIHGFNEGLSTFSTIQNDLILSGRYFNKQHVFCADYSASNTASFITNTEKGIISSEIEKSKEALIKIGYKVKKIDIVGHSMGGNLIRLYLQSDDYKFDIHKLITLNTPHSGTQLANEAFDLLLNHPYLNGLIYMLIPAVDDFKVTSYATRNILNGIDYLNSNIVPSHAITSKIIINETVKQIIKKDKLANLTYILFKFKNPILSSFMMNVVDSMPIKITQYLAQLYNDSNDMVVSINSQKGGLFNSATTTINQESHNGTLKNIYVISRIKELLELPSSSNSFSMDGFHPPILNWPNTPAPVINQNKSMQLANTNDSIRLISPIAGTTVANGQNININIMGTSGVKNILLTILESQDSVVLIDTLTSSFNYNYTVPQTACGKINIMAIGLDTLGNIFIDSSFINVQPNATASSIIIDYPEDSLVLSQGLLGSIYVNCLFSDSIIREITTLPNVIYSLKNNNAAYISQGVFKGIHPGNDTIMVSYSGLTAKMPVHIGNYYSPTDSIKLYDTICQGNTYNFYGNIMNNTGIYDTTFVNQYGGDSIIILNLTVNPLPAIAGTISGLTTVCQGLSSVVYKVPTISNATSYIWTLPSGATGTSNVDSIVVSYGASATSGNITVKGNNTCGSGTVSTKAITVNPLPATAGIISGLATVCQGLSSVVYKVPTISNATSYTWTLPSGATGTNSVDSIVVSFGTSAVSGNITVKGNNSCGSGTVSTKAIIVNPLPANTGTITGLATVCQGQSSVTYKVSTIANATSYTWTLPSGATGTSSVDSIVVNYGTSAVSGNITVKGNNACGSGTVSTKAIIVNPLPANTGTITGLATVCQGQSNVVYKVPTINNATSYTWTLPSGASGTSTIDSVVVSYGTSAVSGNITVKPRLRNRKKSIIFTSKS